MDDGGIGVGNLLHQTAVPRPWIIIPEYRTRFQHNKRLFAGVAARGFFFAQLAVLDHGFIGAVGGITLCRNEVRQRDEAVWVGYAVKAVEQCKRGDSKAPFAAGLSTGIEK